MIKKISTSLVILAILFFAVPAGAQWNISSVSGFGLPNASIYSIVMNILNWLLAIVGIVGVIGFSISGIMYLTAAGNDDQIGKAKTAMLNSIIGVIVALSGLIVIRAVDWALNSYSFF